MPKRKQMYWWRKQKTHRSLMKTGSYWERSRGDKGLSLWAETAFWAHKTRGCAGRLIDTKRYHWGCKPSGQQIRYNPGSRRFYLMVWLGKQASEARGKYGFRYSGDHICPIAPIIQNGNTVNISVVFVTDTLPVRRPDSAALFFNDINIVGT